MPNPFAQFGRQPAVHGQGKVTAGSRRSGPVIPTEPPEQLNLQHWVDYTDPAVVFRNAAGTLPATPPDLVASIRDKGFAGGLLAQASPAAQPVLFQDPSIGFHVARATLKATAHSVFSQPIITASVTGVTLAAVVNTQTAHSTLNRLFGLDIVGVGPKIEFSAIGDIIITIPGIGTVIVSTAPVVGEWNLVYLSADPAGQEAHYGSPGPEVLATLGSPTDVASGITAAANNVGTESTDEAELFAWNINLGLASRANLVAYVDNKYGTLPHA